MGSDGVMYQQALSTTTTTTTTFDTTWYASMNIDVSTIKNQNIKPGQQNLYNRLTNTEIANGGAMSSYGHAALV